MNDALCKGAWDKGCNDIMYMTIAYQSAPSNYTTNGEVVCEFIATEKSVFPLWDFELSALPLNYDAQYGQMLW